MYTTKDLLDLEHTLAKEYLENYEFPWLALNGIKDAIIEIGKKLPAEYKEVKENVWIHETANIYESAFINGPCIIGKNSEVRHSAFIRESALVGDNCVIGNSVELKNCIIFDNSEVPHFNYVGDSILGFRSHMGAGSITSNVRSDKKLVVIHDGTERIETGIRKFGAILGNNVEVGCNAVLNPGTVVGCNSNIYPTSCVRCVVPNDSVYKNSGEITAKK